jgi:hypothetical protein
MDAALVAVVVEPAHLVVQIGVLAEHAKAVAEARRHINLPRPPIAQFDAEPAAERRRAGTQIDGDVEYLTAHHGEKLRLRKSDLEMQAAQHAFTGPRLVVLHKIFGDPVSTVALGMEGFQKEAAVIGEQFRLDDKKARETGFID